MSEAASRLTVKVKLHPAALPPETDTPVVQPAPWSKTRIALASLVLVGAGVAGYQFLLRPVAPAKPAVAAEPELATRQKAAEVSSAAQTTEQATTPAATPPEAEPAVGATSADLAVEPPRPVASPLAEPVAQSVTSQPEGAEPAVSGAEIVSQSNPAAAAPGIHTTAAPAQTIATQVNSVLPQGFSRIVLTDQMNNLQPGKAVGQQIPYPRMNRLYLFTELKGYAGQILRHRWYFGDTLHTDAVLTIEDSPWRTYSENWLLDDQRGPWRVEIVDQTQKVIFQYSFTYQ